MARRGTKFHRKLHGVPKTPHDHQVSGTTLVVKPSGVTISKAAGGIDLTGFGIDFGQGTNYKIYGGVASGNTTSLISPTGAVIVTGLSTIVGFTAFALSGVSTDHVNIINVTAGGVTCVMRSAQTGATVGRLGGVSIHWIAIGT